MSIIRINSLANTVYAPKADGTHVPGPYDAKRRVGEIERLPVPADHQIGMIATLAEKLTGHVAAMAGTSAAALPEDGTVTVMVHGFLFDPTDARQDRAVTGNPHRLIYHTDPLTPSYEAAHHATAWPLHLGFAADDQGEGGVAVAFGWNSGTKFIDYHAAYLDAIAAAWPLLCTLHALGAALKGQRIQILCHSLGSVTVLKAIEMAAARRLPVTRLIDRVVILAGAVTQLNAQMAADAIRGMQGDGGLPGKAGPTFYNVMSAHDVVLSVFAKGFTPTMGGVETVPIGGFGFATGPLKDRWINLRLDNPDFAKWAKQTHGLDVRGDDPDDMLDHWVYYTHLPNIGLYRSILRSAPEWAPAKLRSAARPVPEG